MDTLTQKLLERLERWAKYYQAKSARASSQFGGVLSHSSAMALNRVLADLATGNVTTDYFTYKYLTETTTEPPNIKVSATRQFEPGKFTTIPACVTITVESTETGFKGKAEWKTLSGGCSVDLEIYQTVFNCSQIRVDPYKTAAPDPFTVLASPREFKYLEELFRFTVSEIE